MKIYKPLGTIRCHITRLTQSVENALDSILAAQLDQETKDLKKSKHLK